MSAATRVQTMDPSEHMTERAMQSLGMAESELDLMVARKRAPRDIADFWSFLGEAEGILDTLTDLGFRNRDTALLIRKAAELREIGLAREELFQRLAA